MAGNNATPSLNLEAVGLRLTQHERDNLDALALAHLNRHVNGTCHCGVLPSCER